MDNLTLELTVQEVNAVIEMIEKTTVSGTAAMRVLLGIDAKIRQAVAEAQKKDSPAG